MKTEAELNANILKMTTTIRNEFPELMPFINEMPVTVPTQQSPEINNKILQEYYDSLLNTLLTYGRYHSLFFNNL